MPSKVNNFCNCDGPWVQIDKLLSKCEIAIPSEVLWVAMAVGVESVEIFCSNFNSAGLLQSYNNTLSILPLLITAIVFEVK